MTIRTNSDRIRIHRPIGRRFLRPFPRSRPLSRRQIVLFRHRSGIYLIGRRNVTETGNYDLFLRDLTLEEQSMRYETDYWTKPKRCSLWSVDPETLEVDFIQDLPSNGDTCFPGTVKLNDDQYLIYNYTSPLDDLEMKWVTGQTNPTLIYRVTLTLPASYQSFLLRNNGGRPVPSAFPIEGFNNNPTGVIQAFFGVDATEQAAWRHDLLPARRRPAERSRPDRRLRRRCRALRVWRLR